MKRYWSGLLCALPLLSFAQKKPGPCPDQIATRSMIDSICLEALPEKGYVELTDSTGKGCSCGCDKLLSLTYAEVVRLRQRRDSLYRSNFRRYLSIHSIHPDLPVPTNQRAVTVDASGQATWHVSDTCLRDVQVVGIIQNILAKGFIAFDPDLSFEFVLQTSITDTVFPLIQANENDGLISGNIIIPRRLLASPDVSPMLLEFLILHEIGHAVRLDESEYTADTWASFIGLNIYPHPIPGDLIFMRLAITAGLSRYIMSQFHPEDAPRASPKNCTGVQKCYPELECRLAGIRGDYLGQQDRLLWMDRGYPQDCWSDHVEKYHRLLETSWARPVCAVCKEQRTPPAVPGNPGKLWTELITEIARITTICDRRPGSCIIKNEHLLIAPDEKGNSVTSYRLERSLRRTIRQAKRVNGINPK